MTEGVDLRPSAFNFFVPTREGPVLFNAASGRVLALAGADGTRLARDLSDPRRELGIPEVVSSIPTAVLADFVEGGFLIAGDGDEVDAIRSRYWTARVETPVVLTLTTTIDCNLGCYYCYEERSEAALSVTDVDQIVELAASLLEARSRPCLHVDWYGGEPLLNTAFLEAASAGLQDYCRRAGVQYTASVISNGTCWPDDIQGFVARHRLTQVQISFDGMRRNHDRRRRYRPGRAPSAQASSFDLAVDVVDRLVHCVRVDLRFNIDRKNRGDLLPFIRFARGRGWFDAAFPAVLQPARLAAYSERSAFMRRSQLSADEYDAVRREARDAAATHIAVEESEAPDGFPYPRSSVCAALALDSVVVGADRQLFRCGLQVAEPLRAVGRLGAVPSRKRSLPILGQDDGHWWATFDPTLQPRCSRCSFLPVCWSGCPKKHLEGDTDAVLEQGEYWRSNLARLVAQGVGRTVEDGFRYSEADQFRTVGDLSGTCPGEERA